MTKFECPACKTPALSYQGYRTHLRLSQNPACQQLFHLLHSYVPSDSSDSDELTEPEDNPDNDVHPVTFEGDYFGSSYTPEDFGQSQDAEETVANCQGSLPDLNLDSDSSDEEEYNTDIDAAEQAILEVLPETSRGAPALTPYQDNGDEQSGVEEFSSSSIRRQAIDERLRNAIHIEKFPSALAGAPIHQRRQDNDLRYQADVSDETNNLYAPCSSRLEWEFVRWAKLRGPGATAMTELLKIDGFSERLGLSFTTNNGLNTLIDTLPDRPRFCREEILIAGHSFEFYYRNIIDCIKALWGDPEFAPYLVFAPERHYQDREKEVRLYHEMHTGDWWWEIQEEFEKSHSGATIIPVIISSDKTQVTLFRNKTAYPVYMTIGNLPKFIRRKPSRYAQILIAYLPTTKLTQIKVKASRRRILANLFHTCMSFVINPLIPAGKDGMNLSSGDGAVRRGFPIFAGFVGDYPEQLLVTARKNSECPVGDAERDELGDLDSECIPRDIVPLRQALRSVKNGYDAFYKACSAAGIKPVQNVFWLNLPHTNIHLCITPDVLHQLFQGTEHAQICQLMLGIVIDMRLPNGLSSDRLIHAVRSVLDFLYLAQYPVHSTETLKSLDNVLQRFHDNKQIFVDLGIRQHFNIPKIHYCKHYTSFIKRLGTTDNYSTEYTERLHIDTTKDAYAATNRKDEFRQMTVWLERKEKVAQHDHYIQRRLEGTTIPSTFDLVMMRHPPVLVPHRELLMSKHPSVASVTFSRLLSAYGTKDFEYCLTEYVVKAQAPDHHFTAASLRVAIDRIGFVPFYKVAVYHRIKFTEHDPYSTTRSTEFVADAIHVEPERKDKYGRPVPGRFDTVLIKVNSNNDFSGVKGYRVGQVRCVFTLPKAALKEWFPLPHVQPAKYLVYIDWFTQFKHGPEPNHLMYKVCHAFRPGEDARLASVVPVENIHQSVHLYPKFGPVAPQEWKSSNVLDYCDTFFLNDFLDRSTYATVY
ncbi:hypothetical protein E1B28_006830 [Marasmius oreades]|uniref:Uncharacterized protein n=1 Tax=Marasmius oreades TaxID=181124 RepID=A0A9P7UWX7_9AGAR|nr:uncharacterized protein E1B28_006830 [Marasmius oreades]KAG7096157.1 hypothetical protein E1B28_006830 [Marasmius oreades]